MTPTVYFQQSLSTIIFFNIIVYRYDILLRHSLAGLFKITIERVLNRTKRAQYLKWQGLA